MALDLPAVPQGDSRATVRLTVQGVYDDIHLRNIVDTINDTAYVSEVEVVR